MSRGRDQAGVSRIDARALLLVAAVAVAVVVVFVGPARSATQNIDVGNFYYGSSGTINATVGDRLVFTVVTGTSHTVDIAGLGVASGPFNKDDPPFVVNLSQAGSFTIACAIHQSQNHSVALEVAPAPTTTTTSTTTTAPPTTTTTTEPPGGSTTTTLPGGSTTTTTTPPGGSTTTTTTTPGATTTSTTTAPGGVTTTLPADVATTLAGGVPGTATTSTTRAAGPGVPGATGDGPEPGDQALGITSPSIDDAGWVRPLWWTVLGASIVGLVWVAFAWRRRPTEYD